MSVSNLADYSGIVNSMTQLEIDIERERYQCSFDPNRDPVSLAVVAAVATAKECDPTDLTPLNSTIDSDGPDSIFSDKTDSKQRTGRLSFNYEGFAVTLLSDGTIEIEPADDMD